jgi:hypothetical protein
LPFLTFNGAYVAVGDDPWFSAHEPVMPDAMSPKATHNKSYVRDRLVTTLGCTELHQFCTRSETSTPEACTPLLNILQQMRDPNRIYSMKQTSLQGASSNRIWQAGYASSLGGFVSILTVRDWHLLARKQIHTSIRIRLPATNGNSKQNTGSRLE